MFEGIFTSTFYDAQTGRELKSQEERFSHIILDVKCGGLLKALRSALNDRIDSFEHEVGGAGLRVMSE